jgi:hypothetical protein
MTSLIACLSTGKGTWSQVLQLIRRQEWEKVFLVTNQFGKDNFKSDKPCELIVIDENKSIPELVSDIRAGLSGKIADFEVALNLVSGTGKEHMAVLSAVLKEGLAIRLVSVDSNGITEL